MHDKVIMLMQSRTHIHPLVNSVRGRDADIVNPFNLKSSADHLRRGRLISVFTIGRETPDGSSVCACKFGNPRSTVNSLAKHTKSSEDASPVVCSFAQYISQ